jgi:hypothetical protein
MPARKWPGVRHRRQRHLRAARLTSEPAELRRAAVVTNDINALRSVVKIADAPALRPDRAAEQDAAYDQYIVPTPGKVYWDGLLNSPKIQWDNPKRPPLLLIGGGKDLIADASMTRWIYHR